MGCLQDGISEFAKYILVAFNLLILSAAPVLIGMSIKFRMDYPGLDYSMVTLFPIVLGHIIALIAIFGCYSAVRESSCMLTTYATILIILFIIQMVLGILAVDPIKKNEKNNYNIVHDYLEDVYKQMKDAHSAYTESITLDDWADNMQTELSIPDDPDYVTETVADKLEDQKQLDEFRDFGSDDLDYLLKEDYLKYQEVVDNLQEDLKCCGVDRKDEDYVKTGDGTNLIPGCCKDSPLVCTVENAYNDNCGDKLADDLVGILNAIGVVAIFFGAVELVAAIFAGYVTISYQKSANTYNPMGTHT